MSEEDVGDVEDDGEVPFEEETEDGEEEMCAWCSENPCACAELAEAA